jgi:hypothetical protein
VVQIMGGSCTHLTFLQAVTAHLECLLHQRPGSSTRHAPSVQPHISEAAPGHALLPARLLLLLPHLQQGILGDCQDEGRGALEATLAVVLDLGLPALLAKGVDGLQQGWEAASWH